MKYTYQDYEKSQLVKEYNEAIKNADIKTPIDNSIYPLGQIFHTTGKIFIKNTIIQNKKAFYVALETTEGVDISIFVERPSYYSIKRFETSGTFVSESIDGEKLIKKEITAQVVEDFDIAEIFYPSSSYIYDIKDFIVQSETTNFFVNKTIRYLGNVVSPSIARADSNCEKSVENFKKGMRRAISVNLWEVSHNGMKFIDFDKTSNTETKFIKTYGESNYQVWETLSLSQKEEYRELEQLCSDYYMLYKDHYDDLKLYALMYRNVPLFNIDLRSIIFFASKKEDIIGYKERIMNDKSDKAEIVRLYFSNEAMFPEVCNKYIGRNSLPSYKSRITKQKEKIIDYKKYIENGIPEISSIYHLSTEDCHCIIKHKNEIDTDIRSLCQVSLPIGDYHPFTSFHHGISPGKEYLQYISNSSKFVLSRTNRWLMLNGYKDFKKDIKKIEDYSIELLTSIEKRSRETAQLIVSKYLEKRSKTFCFIKKPELNSIIHIPSYHVGISRLEKRIYELLNELTKVQHQPPSNNPWLEEIKNNIEKYDSWIFSYDHYNDTQRVDHLNTLRYGSTPIFGDSMFYRRPFLTSFTYNPKQIEELKELEIKRKKRLEELAELYLKYKEELKRLKTLKDEILCKQRKERDERTNHIESLKKDILSIQNEIKNTENLREQYALETSSCKILSANQSEVKTYIENSYHRLYTLLWSYFPIKIRDIERYMYNANSIQNLLENGTLIRISAWHIKKGVLMSTWCGAILEERKQLKKLEEEKRKAEEERLRLAEEARREKFRYNQKNVHYRDKNLHFNEKTHTYTINGIILQSVTNLVENCFPKFNAKEHASHTAVKMDISADEVIAMWERKGKESRDLGTIMHHKIDNYFQGNDSPEDDAFKLFKIFASKVELSPYRTEWAVYDTNYNIAGTIDFVDYQHGKFTIYDWKRSDKVIFNGMPIKNSKYQEKGLFPLEHLENCAYYHYALQLSLYKFILEKNYNMVIDELRLGIFHPTYDKPYVLKIAYLENEIKTLMELRSEIIL